MSRTQISTTLISNSGPSAIVPSGTILDFGGPTAPSGWTECDGSVLSQAGFPTLFAAIGTTWNTGGEGGGNFRVPDLRRRTTIGRGGASSGTVANTLGSIGGEEAHAQTASELATHNHTVNDPGHNHTVNDPGHTHGIPVFTNNGVNGNHPFAVSSNVSNGTHTSNSSGTGISNNSNTTGITTVNNGSGTAANVMQPVAVVIKIIKN